MALSIEEAVEFRRRGFRCLAYSGDLWLYQSALKAGLEQIAGAIDLDQGPRQG